MSDRARHLETLRAIARELLARKCRATFEAFAVEAMRRLGYSLQPHHLLLVRALERVAAGEITRLAVMMPPGSAKSTYVSVLFNMWFMCTRRADVIAGTHTGSLAEKISRKVMSLMMECGDELFGVVPATEGVKDWEATNASTFMPVGIGGPITGRRADLLNIDDPVKSRAEASSLVVRDATHQWLLSDALTRLRPGAPVIITMTRWHEDDLLGRMLQAGADQWHVLCIRAESRGPDDDPLGRPAGAFLWDNDPAYSYGAQLREAKAELARNRSLGDWEALYQQDPRPGEGGIFVSRPEGMRVLSSPPPVKRVVRGWDFAATEETGRGNPDFTVGLKLGEQDSGRYVVLDIVRMRGAPHEVEAALVETARADGVGCVVGLPQDPGQAGKSQAKYLTRALSGFVVRTGLESGNKVERAMPAASQWNAGNIDVVAGEYLTPFLNEVDMFPNGTKKDQVDALSRAFVTLTGGGGPLIVGTANWMGR